MIVGGLWDSQNKTLNGVYINFKSKKPSKKQSAITKNLLLVDKNGVPLKTADGFYLTVKGDVHMNEFVLSQTAEEVQIALNNALRGQGQNSSVRVGEINLYAAEWMGDASPYSQVVSIDGITKYSQVDLKPDIEQLTIFHDKDLAFVTENDDGVVTVYALGDKPTNDYVIQISITEVSV